MAGVDCFTLFLNRDETFLSCNSNPLTIGANRLNVDVHISAQPVRVETISFREVGISTMSAERSECKLRLVYNCTPGVDYGDYTPLYCKDGALYTSEGEPIYILKWQIELN